VPQAPGFLCVTGKISYLLQNTEVLTTFQDSRGRGLGGVEEAVLEVACGEGFIHSLQQSLGRIGYENGPESADQSSFIISGITRVDNF
jgi:hypothetical protein